MFFFFFERLSVVKVETMVSLSFKKKKKLCWALWFLFRATLPAPQGQKTFKTDKEKKIRIGSFLFFEKVQKRKLEMQFDLGSCELFLQKNLLRVFFEKLFELGLFFFFWAASSLARLGYFRAHHKWEMTQMTHSNMSDESGWPNNTSSQRGDWKLMLAAWRPTGRAHPCL